MRRINFKFLIVLVVSVAAFSAVIRWVHAFQVHRHSGMFLREAEREERAGNTSEAAEYLRRYLLLEPNDAATATRLAAMLLDQHRLQEAYYLFSQTIQRQPNNDNARCRLVDIALKLRRFEDAKYQLEYLLHPPRPQDGELLFQLAVCQQSLGQYGVASTSYETAYGLKPSLVSAYAAPRRFAGRPFGPGQLRRRNPEKNDPLQSVQQRGLPSVGGIPPVVRRSLRSSKRPFSKTRRSRSTNSNVREMLRLSLEYANRAMALAPADDSRTLLAAARTALATGSPELVKQAKNFAERAFKKDPSDAGSYLVLASIDLRENRVKDAIERLNRGLTATGGDGSLALTLANVELDANEVAKARKLIDRLRKVGPFSQVVRYFDARLSIANSNWTEAVRELQGMSGELAEWPQLQKESQFWLAQCYERLGRDDLRITAYRNALEIDPLWPPARMGLADALRRSAESTMPSSNIAGWRYFPILRRKLRS